MPWSVSPPDPAGSAADVDRARTETIDYAAFNLLWGALLAGVLGAASRTGGEAPPGRELPVLGLASFALTKALAKEKVGVWVREPVAAEEDGRRPRGHRLRYVAGELVTCTRCLGAWTSLGLVGLRVLRPREGRVVSTVLASAALNDWLQSGFTWVCASANAVQRRAEGGSRGGGEELARAAERVTEAAERAAGG